MQNSFGNISYVMEGLVSVDEAHVRSEGFEIISSFLSDPPLLLCDSPYDGNHRCK